MASLFVEGDLISWLRGELPGVRVSGDAEPREFLFELHRWGDAPSRLDVGAGGPYRRLGESGDFGKWWADRCGGDRPGIRRFRVRMPPPLWERPWEAIVSALDTSRWADVSILRQTQDDHQPNQVSELDGPLSVLCLQGAASGIDLHVLDLDAEFSGISRAYESLDLSARNAIVPPAVKKIKSSDLEALLRIHRPSVLWFSGHARSSPPGLLLQDDHWLTPEELATAIKKVGLEGGKTPLYVVLWGCDTGSAQRFETPKAAPPFIDALAECGVLALVASQAPLPDRAAIRVAHQIFVALGSGRPIDHGVARARDQLMRTPGQNLAEETDWICPVVWCKGSAPETLRWSDGREKGARRQDATRKLLPAELREILQLEDIEARSITPWPDNPKLWIASTAPGSATARVSWAERVLAIQRHAEKSVLWFNFGSPRNDSPSVSRVLRDWADLVQRRIEHDDDRDLTIRMAAQSVKEDAESGWASICSNQAFIIAMIEPPERGSDWLWKSLQHQAPARTIVLARDYSDDRSKEGWKVDSLMDALSAGSVPVSRTLAALAVLGQPAARSDIEKAAKEDLQPWIKQSVVLETTAGCIMPAGLAERIARTLSPESLSEAHRLAYAFLDGPVAIRKLTERSREELLVARWRHAHESEFATAIRVDGINLLDLYGSQRRNSLFLNVFERISGQQESFTPDLIIDAAWSYLDLGDSEKARSWLGVREPEDLEPAAAASWYSAMAEVEKASGLKGSKEAALENLQKALVAIEGESSQDVIRRRLSIRHDIARLTHFFLRQPTQAAILYKAVLQDWEAIPHSELDRAITARNLAEAYMDCDELGEAENQASRARDLIPEWTQHPVCSELEYFWGRLAKRQKLEYREIYSRFETCLRRALDTSHLMMAKIVDDRLFWLSDPGISSAGLFDDAAWAIVSTSLSLYRRHAWAARVLINGRLRAARRLATRGERTIALKELKDVQDLISANPSFDSGDDRRRIVAFYAGLSLFEKSGQDWWLRLKQDYSWSQEWLDAKQITNSQPGWEEAG